MLIGYLLIDVDHNKYGDKRDRPLRSHFFSP